MTYQEIPLVFFCENCRLIGIATQPESTSITGVLVVVGGPQYRSGSHRQFTLFARELAGKGVASLRFDYRGMGDSEGEMRTFESVNLDLQSAIDAFQATVPEVEKVVIWGLCDAAAAALYYAYTDSRICGLVMLNPWVHTDESAKRARVKHYYMERLMQKSFWARLFSGQIRLWDSVSELASAIRAFLIKQKTPGNYDDSSKTGYIDRMLDSLVRFHGKALIILSGKDLVAQEFQELVNSDDAWKTACQPPKVTIQVISEANHTFSSKHWRDLAFITTWNWLDKEI